MGTSTPVVFDALGAFEKTVYVTLNVPVVVYRVIKALAKRELLYVRAIILATFSITL